MTLLSARLQPTCGQISSFTELLGEKFKSGRDSNAAASTTERGDGGGEEGGIADNDEQTAAAASGSKRGADGEKRDDDKVEKGGLRTEACGQSCGAF